MVGIDRERLNYIFLILLKIFTLIFVFYVMTHFKKGGDIKYLIPFLSGITALIYTGLKKDYSLLSNPIFISLSCYVLMSYLLIPFSIEPDYSFKEINKTILAGFFLFISIYTVTTVDRDSTLIMKFLFLIWIILLTGSVISFMSGRTMYHGHLYPDTRVVRFGLHHNGFAMLLNIFFPLFIASYIINLERKRKKGFIIMWFIIITVVAIFLTGSRGGWVSLAFTIFIWSLYLVKKNILQLKIVAGSIIIILASFLIMWNTVPVVKERIDNLGKDIPTLTRRTIIWNNYLRGFLESPVTGHGYGENIIMVEEPRRVRKDEYYIFDLYGKHSHNMVLQILFQQGVLGFLTFLAYFLSCIYAIMKNILISKDDLPLQSTNYAFLSIFLSVFILHGLIEVVYFEWLCLTGGMLSGYNSVRRGIV